MSLRTNNVISVNTGHPIQITDGKDISLSGRTSIRPQVVAPDQVRLSRGKEFINGRRSPFPAE